MPCPNCGSNHIYRSHTKNVTEKLIRELFPFRYYRCHDCGWRGVKSHIRWRKISKNVFSVLYVLFVSALVLGLLGVVVFLLLFRPV